jgi:bifunctional non-homologous end joining protein LigD
MSEEQNTKIGGLKSENSQAALARHFSPMLATLTDKPFDSLQWQYEIKWDGFRALTEIDNGQVDIISRNEKSYNARFFPLLETMKHWSIRAVIDGEIVIEKPDGSSDFASLQSWHSPQDGKLVYHVFDILDHNGQDLTILPLSKRLEVLSSILPEDPNVRISQVFGVSGIEAFQFARTNGLEGIIAKKKDSQYYSGKRSREWLKIKVKKRQEVVICGYTIKNDSPRPFSALLLGIYFDSSLMYIGKVGTGFNEKLESTLLALFEPLKTEHAMFKVPENKGSERVDQLQSHEQKVIFLQPELVCEIEFAEITRDGFFRHPSFKGLRVDKIASTVTRELEIPLAGLLKAGNI